MTRGRPLLKSNVLMMNTIISFHRVWQQMQQAGVIPNRITEFNLASAFAPCPTLAAEVVLEARAIRCASYSWSMDIIVT